MAKKQANKHEGGENSGLGVGKRDKKGWGHSDTQGLETILIADLKSLNSATGLGEGHNFWLEGKEVNFIFAWEMEYKKLVCLNAV